MNYNPIILALDYHSYDEAWYMLNKVSPHIGMMKIGLELYSAMGNTSLNLARGKEEFAFGVPIFLDLKLCDIPTTISKTVNVLCDRFSYIKGQHFLSVHTYGGPDMINAAITAAKGSNVEIVGITAMTSFTEDHIHSIGIGGSLNNLTINLACLSKELKTYVCGPEQIEAVRWAAGNDVKLIVPGIRFDLDKKDDHTSPFTPEAAMAAGASYIVVGRAITQATDPVAAVMECCKRVGINSDAQRT